MKRNIIKHTLFANQIVLFTFLSIINFTTQKSNFNNNNGNNGTVQIKADINGIGATLLIDTGSNLSLIHI